MRREKYVRNWVDWIVCLVEEKVKRNEEERSVDFFKSTIIPLKVQCIKDKKKVCVAS
jgi:hypothetical protein